ncbi:hypothetical protein AX16_010676 [Volvariella volvacea WC 439]|nr:hypothetical protein AX16_010676 [Volvariella volvacea WC 439]
MKLAYPAFHKHGNLNQQQLAIKIARHSPCSLCSTCHGFQPPPGVEVVFDDAPSQALLGELGQYGSDDEDISAPYLDVCFCGHQVKDHGASPAELSPEEFARRGRVAVRLDELLQDVGRLLDFNYVDEDIASLRKQMKLPVSLVSPIIPSTSSPDHRSQSTAPSTASSDLSDPPPAKKRKVSVSSLSDDDANSNDDEEDEEDKPLASRVASKASALRSQRSKRPGKKAPGMKAKRSHTSSASYAQPGEEGEVNDGQSGRELKIKVEDKMDEGQLTRLATGVPVDGGTSGTFQPPTKVEKAAVVELRKGIIQFTAVQNDKQPRSMVILTGLKTLFQKQLPKMPREYIARLVFDSNSKALAIIKRGYKVVGGICYRPFPHRGFAEIVFFATASVDQEKGYGGLLMDHFKSHIRGTYPDMNHFLTYADNYAVGYFEKQGFSKEITLDRSVWAGYIKDYEGGTIMQCTMLPKVDYLNKAEILAIQQEAVMTKIRQVSRSHIVYPGLPQFQPGPNQATSVDPKDVPGLRESGWTPNMVSSGPRGGLKSADFYFMERLLKDLQARPQAWAFLKPVNAEDVPDYYDVITNPMDFSTMEHKLEMNQYPSVQAFVDDVMLVFNNCRKYNPETTIYYRNATKLEGWLKEQLADRHKRE